MIVTVTGQRFICVPYTAPITRARCAEMHRQGEAGQREKCRGCVVGSDHARGLVAITWADGSPVELPASVPLAAARPELARGETTMATQLTHDGITDTFEGWGRRLGVTGAAIRMRLKKYEGDFAKTLARSDAPARPRVLSADRAARSIALDARARADEKAAAAKTKRTPRSTPAPRPAPIPTPAVEAARAVRDQLTALDPLELLRRLGWQVDELGPTPAGRLFVIGTEAR